MTISPCRRSGASSRHPLGSHLVRLLAAATLLLAPALPAESQTLSQRGFVEGTLFVFPQEAPNDSTQLVGDLLVRDEVFYKPSAWLQFAGGMELRGNSHDQVEHDWSVDYRDRGLLRPRLSVRRLSATLNHGHFTADLGKQFIRWGAADIVNPTDRFAPRDYLNVVDSEFIGITGARGTAQFGGHTLELVWTPKFTPSRTPLLDQRWVVVSDDQTQGLPLEPAPQQFPSGTQTGVRWRHVANRFEYSLSFFNGFNYLPDLQATVVVSGQPPAVVPTAIQVANIFPPIRTYGADLAYPLRWMTIKAEAAYFTSSLATSDEYGLYVIQAERQSGEWLLVGGYAGDVVTHQRSSVSFAPDRGTSRSFLGRVSRTIDVNRSFSVEGAVHQNGRGGYGKGEYSQVVGQHWRATATGVVLGGKDDDFFGQYDKNSHVKLTLRYSF